MRIAVVGDVDADTLGKLLDKTFGGLPAKASLTQIAEVEATKPPQRAFVPLDVPQTVVTFGGPGIRRHDPNFMAAYVVNHILGGGGLSSRLYKEVREKRGLAYSVYESLLWMDRSALFIGNTGTRADRAGETVDAIEKEVRRIAEEGPTQKELDEAKSYLKGSQMLALDTSSKLAQALLQYQLDKLPIDYIEKRNAIVDAVTLDDARCVERMARGAQHLAAGRGDDPGRIVLELMPECVVRSQKEPGRAPVLDDRGGGPVRHRIGVIGPVEAERRALLIGQCGGTGAGIEDDPLLLARKALDRKRDARIRHVHDRIDAFDIEPAAGDRRADIRLVLVIRRDDLHRLAEDLAIDLPHGHLGGDQ